MLAADQRADGLDADVRREEEELDRDELLGSLLGGLGHHARAGEAPDDDHAGEPFDGGVEAEADERDRPGHDPGRDRDDPLDAHRSEREPRQQPHTARELAVALARDRGDRPSADGRRRRERQLERRAHAPPPAVARRRPAARGRGRSARTGPSCPRAWSSPAARRAAPGRGGRRASRCGRRSRRDRTRTPSRASSSAIATASRVGSASALAPAGPRSSASASGCRARAASALGRSRQSRSQVSGSVTSSRLVHSHDRTDVRACAATPRCSTGTARSHRPAWRARSGRAGR